MKRGGRLLAVILTLVAGLSINATADEVILKDGNKREGRVEEIPGDRANVRLITGSQQIRLPKSRIEQIIEQSDAEDYTILGNQSLKVNRNETAVQMFQKALAADSNHAPAQEGLEKARELIAAEAEEAKRQQQSRNSESLNEVREMIREGDFEEAEATLLQVMRADPTQEQVKTAQVLNRDLHLEWAKSLEDRLNIEGAERHLLRVLRVDPNNKEAQDLLVRVWEDNPQRKDDLMRIYSLRLQSDPEDLTLNQKLADLLLASNKQVESIPYLLRLHESQRYRSLNYDDRLQSAMQLKGRQLASAGKIDEAIDVYEKLGELFPGTGATSLAYLRYVQKRESLEIGRASCRERVSFTV